MAPSRRYKRLVSRLERLRQHFLPAQFSPTGMYGARDQDLARGYLVLVHAEIEAYCEDRSEAVARRAHERWKRNGRLGKTLRGLISFHNVQNRQPWKAIDRAPNRVDAAVQSYLSVITQNHGIKEENICKMLFPIGIEIRELDNVWLATIDSFGTMRGTIAHKSVIAQQAVDPATEYTRLTNQILPGLRKLDRKISDL